MAIDLEKYKLANNLDRYQLEQPQADNRNLLEKAEDFALKSPVGPLGEAVSNSIGSIGAYLKGDKAKAKELSDANGANMGKILGSTAFAAAAPASMAVAPTSIVGAAGTYGSLGAIQGGGAALAEGDDLKQAATKAFVSGLTGAVVGGTLQGIANTASKLADKGPEAIYNNALKVTQKIKNADKSPSDFLIKEGVWGPLGTFKKAAEEGIGAENSIIKQAAYNTPGGMTYDDVLAKAAKYMDKELGDLYTPQELDQLLQNVPLARIKNAQGEVPWVDVDGVRSALGHLIGDNKWLQTTPTQTTKAAESVYRALSDSVKEATGTAKQFSRLSQWIQTQKVVNRAMGIADAKYGLGLFDVLSGGSGFLAGGPLMGLAGVGLQRAVREPAVQTATAQALPLASKVIGGVTRGAQVATPTVTSAATNAVMPKAKNGR